MRQMLKKIKENEALRFAGRTLFYFAVLLTLLYLYHYKNISGGNFIYNEF